MNQKPIKDVEEERKDEGSGMNDFLAAVFFILVLPLALAKYATSRWAARPGIWRIKEFKTEIRKAVILAIPINLLALVITWNALKTHQWVLVSLGIFLLWISLIPTALVISSHQLLWRMQLEFFS
jgi:hypothetical protein